jgi:hypothetical protein
MTVSLPIKAAFEAVKTAAHTGAGASYATVGTALAHPAYALIITSSFDKSVWLSTDGTNDYILIRATSDVVIDIGSNKQGTALLSLPTGTQFYLKQGPDGAPTGGDIGITPLYAR